MRDVVIIGGGMAGLAAARGLVRKGHDVLLLEARDRLGGRTWYKPFEGTPYHIEMGGAWFEPTTQTSIGKEVERYSLPTVLSPEGRNLRSVLAGRPLQPHEIPVPPEVQADLERAMETIVGLSYRVPLDDPLADPAMSAYDVPLTEVLEPLGLADIVRDYFAMWAGFAFGCYPSEISAVQALRWVNGYDNAVWTLNDAPATKFKEGTASLIDALAVDSGAEIALGRPVAAIERTSGGILVRESDGSGHHARAVVLATPLNTWAEMDIEGLSTAKADFAAEGQAGRGVKVWAIATDLPEFMIGSGWGGPLNWVSEQAHKGDERLIVGLGCDSSLLDPTDRPSVQDAVAQFAPDVKVLVCDGHDWTSDPYARGTWMAYRPGQLTRYRSAMSSPEPPVFFAGSDIARSWSGFMDGALDSGREAVAAVTDFLRGSA